MARQIKEISSGVFRLIHVVLSFLLSLINNLQPESVRKINHSQLNWHKVRHSWAPDSFMKLSLLYLCCCCFLLVLLDTQPPSFPLFFFFPLQLENLGNFIKAILAYGLKPNDIFEANDLFESGNMTQVQTTLLALASMVRTGGHCPLRNTFSIVAGNTSNVMSGLWWACSLFQSKTRGSDTKIDIGVKYADKQTRHFDDEKIKAGQCVIGLQVTLTGDKGILMTTHELDVTESLCLV